MRLLKPSIFPQILIIAFILSGCDGNMPVTATISSSLPATAFGPSIHIIQGADHISPLTGQSVKNVHGIVTFVRKDGFYMQDPAPDTEVGTSEGLFIFTAAKPNVRNGDEVLVDGTVEEMYPGGISTGNLSITQIKSPVARVINSGLPLPAPVTIGRGGRIPPGEVIKSDREIYKPNTDGLDFYESLENMLVQVNDAVAAGPTNSFKETAVLADGGKDASVRTPRGGIVVRENDFNPERIIIDDLFTVLPDYDTGDRFTQPLIGILDYNYGNFKLQLTQKPVVEKGGLEKETAPAAKTEELSIAAMNVQNLDPGDGIQRFTDIARVIVYQLGAPDILSLDEIQDNNGPVDDGTVDAHMTSQMLIDAVTAVGGPKYQYRDIAPESDKDGGETGGNIRAGFLFRADRGLKFIDFPGGTASAAVEVRNGASGVE
jgi:uncharacterized protein